MYRHAFCLTVPALVLAACSSATELAAPSIPSRVSEVSSTYMEGNAATAAIASPTVLVEDQYGSPMPGVTVTFSVILGGGTLATPQVLTNDLGLASAGVWILGPELGENRVVANVVGAGSVTFTAIAQIPAGPLTQPTQENLEVLVFRLSAVNGRSVPIAVSSGAVQGAVLSFRDGRFAITYTYSQGNGTYTEFVAGAYDIEGFDIKLYAGAAALAPVIATLRGKTLTLKTSSYAWPLAPSTEVYSQPAIGEGRNGTWTGTAGLAALDMESFTLVLHQLANGSLEGTWTGTRISCSCAVSGYVWNPYSFAAIDTVSIALQFGKSGDPTNYLDPYGVIAAKPIDAAHIVGEMYMAFDGDKPNAVSYQGRVTLTKT